MDQEYRGGRSRLPGPDDGDWMASGTSAGQAATRRDAGVRQTRRVSNWTVAALIAGVAATSGYFAHAAATPAVSTVGTTQQGAVSGGAQKPSLSHAVVTSGGSGVTVGSSGGAGGAGGGTVTWRDN